MPCCPPVSTKYEHINWTRWLCSVNPPVPPGQSPASPSVLFFCTLRSFPRPPPAPRKPTSRARPSFHVILFVREINRQHGLRGRLLLTALFSSFVKLLPFLVASLGHRVRGIPRILPDFFRSRRDISQTSSLRNVPARFRRLVAVYL